MGLNLIGNTSGWTIVIVLIGSAILAGIPLKKEAKLASMPVKKQAKKKI